ncbi:MAG: SMC-Scp complex subunit ScpB [bacterium]|nr:SMC-Scp complex subunit ScpB [bacterium]
MDDISREPLPDSTESAPDRGAQRQAGADSSREKGPQPESSRELLARERSELQDDLVVDPRNPGASDERPEELDAADADVGSDAGVLPATAADADADADAAVDADANDSIDAAKLAAALQDEASTAEIEEELGAPEEGLPDVPELADAEAVADVVFVLMLTSREGLTIFRLAQACNTTQKLVEAALDVLQQRLTELRLPVELARNGDTVKWLAQDSTFPYLQRLRGVKKLEKLSPAALETLAVVAYRQPVMRSEIEAIRGVKAGPMLRSLLQHKLVRVTGRADVPGRPLQYGTTKQFLERFGLASLQELPSVKEWKNLG